MTPPKIIRFQDAAAERAKRFRTRALLMDCAIAEFAIKGIHRTSVDDIVVKAKVSHGTFYYHFANKTEIVEAVGRAVAAGLVTVTDQEIREVKTGLERVALATQIFIEMASAIPNWGWLIVDALANMGTFHDYISRGIRKDVLIGMRSGEFVVEPGELLFDGLLSVVGTAIRMRLDSPGEQQVAPRAAEMVLLMLGVPLAVAQTLPGQVMRKYGGERKNSADAVQENLHSIMPLLLQEILADQATTAAPRGGS